MCRCLGSFPMPQCLFITVTECADRCVATGLHGLRQRDYFRQIPERVLPSWRRRPVQPNEDSRRHHLGPFFVGVHTRREDPLLPRASSVGAAQVSPDRQSRSTRITGSCNLKLSRVCRDRAKTAGRFPDGLDEGMVSSSIPKRLRKRSCRLHSKPRINPTCTS
jgi:hypothetical protein